MKRPKRPLLLRIAFWALIAFLVSIPVGLAFLEYTTQPEFCSSCHIMEPYVQSWRDSAHSKVSCVECHYEPGILETAEGKFKAINQVVKYVTNTEGSKPWAQVSDDSCMRSGCHSTRLLSGKVDFRLGRTSIPFDHTPHLLEMRRSKKLRCTSCHSQIVQGEHLTVTTTTCLLCHFKGAEEDPKLSECRTCHAPPDRPIDVGGFQFSHDQYLARGVGCESCHGNITQGTGEVPKRRCASCHAVQEHIERIGDTEFLHATHVTKHHVDCLECHTEMTHRLRDKPETSKGECATCHASGHGQASAFYRGEGGRLAAATPNPMYLTRVGCDGCHRPLGAPAGSHADAAPGHAAGGDRVGALGAKEVACIACHGPGVDGMMARWQAEFPPAADAVAGAVDAARKAAESAGRADLAASLGDAAHDAALAKGDRSRGVHNPWFSRKLLEGAFGRAEDVLAKLDAARARAPFPLGPSFPTKHDCASVCHVGIERRDIRVEGTRFVHAKHLGWSDCDACHDTASSATAPDRHGRVLDRARDCVSCHHGPLAPEGRTCASCHAETDRLLRGEFVEGGEVTQMMAKVACTECHGDTPRTPVRASMQEQCNRCHKERYPSAVADWTADSDEWFAEAEARLAKIRARAKASGRVPPTLAAAETLVARLREAGPAHNVLLFEELKDAFDEAASAAEK